MWLGDWFLIAQKQENYYSAVHKYYVKDDGKLTSVKQIMSTYDMTFPEVHALFDGRIRGTLIEKYNLRQVKHKICRLNLTDEEVLQIRKLLIESTDIYDIKNNKSYVNV